ncbi:MAG: hypothetical protein HY558_04265 [Euryarchaeota archaeon]|nr:hypothetical protein [Euryarchaeota archaeon]
MVAPDELQKVAKKLEEARGLTETTEKLKPLLQEMQGLATLADEVRQRLQATEGDLKNLQRDVILKFGSLEKSLHTLQKEAEEFVRKPTLGALWSTVEELKFLKGEASKEVLSGLEYARKLAGKELVERTEVEELRRRVETMQRIPEELARRMEEQQRLLNAMKVQSGDPGKLKEYQAMVQRLGELEGLRKSMADRLTAGEKMLSELEKTKGELVKRSEIQKVLALYEQVAELPAQMEKRLQAQAEALQKTAGPSPMAPLQRQVDAMAKAQEERLALVERRVTGVSTALDEFRALAREVPRVTARLEEQRALLEQLRQSAPTGMAADVTELRKTAEELRTRLSQVAARVEEMGPRAELEKMAATLQEYRDLPRELEKRIAAHEALLAELQRLPAEMARRDDLQRLTGALEEAKGLPRELEKRIQAQEKHAEELQAAVTRLDEATLQAVTETLQEMRGPAQALEKRVEAQDSAVRGLHTTLDEVRRGLDQARALAQQAARALEEKVQGHESALRAAREQAETATGLASQTVREMETLRAEPARLATRLEEQTRGVQSLRELVGALEHRAESQRTLIEHIQQELTRTIRAPQWEEANRRAAETQQATVRLDARLQADGERIEALRKELQAAARAEEVARLASALEDLQSTLPGTLARIITAEDRLTRAETTLTDTVHGPQMEEAITRLRTSLDAQARALQDAQDSLRDTIHRPQMETALQELRAALENQDRALEELRASHAPRMQELARGLEETRASAGENTRRLQTLEEGLRETGAQATRGIEETRQREADLEQRLGALTESLGALTDTSGQQSAETRRVLDETRGRLEERLHTQGVALGETEARLQKALEEERTRREEALAPLENLERSLENRMQVHEIAIREMKALPQEVAQRVESQGAAIEQTRQELARLRAAELEPLARTIGELQAHGPEIERRLALQEKSLGELGARLQTRAGRADMEPLARRVEDLQRFPQEARQRLDIQSKALDDLRATVARGATREEMAEVHRRLAEATLLPKELQTRLAKQETETRTLAQRLDRSLPREEMEPVHRGLTELQRLHGELQAQLAPLGAQMDTLRTDLSRLPALEEAHRETRERLQGLLRTQELGLAELRRQMEQRAPTPRVEAIETAVTDLREKTAQAAPRDQVDALTTRLETLATTTQRLTQETETHKTALHALGTGLEAAAPRSQMEALETALADLQKKTAQAAPQTQMDTLANRLETLATEAQHLTEQAQTQNTALQQAQKRLAETAPRDQVDALTTRLETLATTTQRLTQETETHKTALHALGTGLEAAAPRSQTDALAATVADLKETVGTAAARVDEAARAATGAEERLVAQEHAVEQRLLQSEKDQKQREENRSRDLDTLRAEVKALREKFPLREEMHQAVADSIAPLENRVALRAESIERDLREVQGQLQNTLKTGELERTMAGLRAEVNEKLARSEVRLDTAEREMRQTLGDHRAHLDDLSQKVHHLSLGVEEVRPLAGAHQTLARDLQELRGHTEERTAGLERRAADTAQALSRMARSTDLEMVSRSAQESQEAIRLLRERQAGQEAHLNALQERIGHLGTALTEWRGKSTDADSRATETLARLDEETRLQRETLEGYRHEAGERVAQVETRMAEEKRQTDARDRVLAELQRGMEERLSGLETQAKSLAQRAEVEAQGTRLEQSLRETSERLAREASLRLDERARGLEEAIATATVRLNVLSGTSEELGSRQAEATGRADEALTRLASLESRMGEWTDRFYSRQEGATLQGALEEARRWSETASQRLDQGVKALQGEQQARLGALEAQARQFTEEQSRLMRTRLEAFEKMLAEGETALRGMRGQMETRLSSQEKAVRDLALMPTRLDEERVRTQAALSGVAKRIDAIKEMATVAADRGADLAGRLARAEEQGLGTARELQQQEALRKEEKREVERHVAELAQSHETALANLKNLLDLRGMEEMERRLRQLEKGQTEIFEDYLHRLEEISGQMSELREHLEVVFRRGSEGALEEEEQRLQRLRGELQKDLERGTLAPEAHGQALAKLDIRLRGVRIAREESRRLADLAVQAQEHQQSLANLGVQSASWSERMDTLEGLLRAQTQTLEGRLKGLAEVDSRVIDELATLRSLTQRVVEQEAALRRLRAMVEGLAGRATLLDLEPRETGKERAR